MKLNMKNSIYLLLLMAFFILSACGQDSSGKINVDNQPTGPVVDEQLPPPVPQEPTPTCYDGKQNQGETGIDCGGPCASCLAPGSEISEEEDIDYQMTAEQLEAIKVKVPKGTKSAFLANAYPKGLKVGESYTFVHGMSNMDLEASELEFRYSVIYKYARDSKNNPITGDASTIQAWFSGNDFPTPTLARYEASFIPLGVTVGKEISPGVATKPGSYYFELVVEKDMGYRWVEYLKDEFSFRVIE